MFDDDEYNYHKRKKQDWTWKQYLLGGKEQ